MELIDKTVIVAEIEKIQNEFSDSPDRHGNFDDLENQGAYKALDRLESFLDTLETKKLDLDFIKKELDELIRKPNGDFGWGTLYNVATHFFELGLKAQKGE